LLPLDPRRTGDFSMIVADDLRHAGNRPRRPARPTVDRCARVVGEDRSRNGPDLRSRARAGMGESPALVGECGLFMMAAASFPRLTGDGKAISTVARRCFGDGAPAIAAEGTTPWV
jgi:hypothetical protein